MKIRIQNFRGISSFEEDIANKEISGRNGSGKTTILNAVAWLLTGYTLDDSDSPKVQENGKALDLATRVECEIVGTKLARSYQEVWRKNRQTLELEFRGNESNYFINDELIRKQEFDELTNQFVLDGLNLKESVFSFIEPSYFFQKLEEKKRMKIVNDNLSVLSPYDYAKEINSNLADWYESVSDTEKERAKMVAKCNTLGNTLKDLEAAQKEKIKDVNVELAKLNNEQKRALEAKLEDLRVKIATDSTKALKLEIEAEKQKATADFMTEKAEFEMAEFKRIQEEEKKANAEREKILAGNETIREKNRTIKQEHDRAVNDYQNIENEIKRTESLIQGLRDDFKAELEVVFQGYTCPILKESCDMLKENPDIEKLEADFNLKKSTALETINETGVKLKAKLEELKKHQKPTDPTLLKEKPAPELIRLTPQKFEKQLDLSEFDKRISNIKPDDKTDLIDQKEALEAQLKELQKLEFQHEERAKDIARVKELQNEIDIVKEDNLNLQRKVAFIHGFNIWRAERLESEAKEKFGFAVKLFEFQVNGTAKTVCKFLDEKGVELASVNNASRLNNGIKLCDILQGIYNVNLPILADNVESVNKLQKTKRTLVATRVTTSELTITSLEV